MFSVPNTSLLNTTSSWHDVWKQLDDFPSGLASGEFTLLSMAMPNYPRLPAPERAPCPAPSQVCNLDGVQWQQSQLAGPGRYYVTGIFFDGCRQLHLLRAHLTTASHAGVPPRIHCSAATLARATS